MKCNLLAHESPNKIVSLLVDIFVAPRAIPKKVQA